MEENLGKVDVVFKKSSSKDGNYGFDVTVQLPATKEVNKELLDKNADMAFNRAVSLIRAASKEIGQ